MSEKVKENSLWQLKLFKKGRRGTTQKNHIKKLARKRETHLETQLMSLLWLTNGLEGTSKCTDVYFRTNIYFILVIGVRMDAIIC